MARLHKVFIAPAIVALTVTATACSDRSSSDSKSKKAPEAAAAVPTTFVDEGVSKAATPAPAGPVTFADGEAAFQTRNYGEAARIFARYTEQRPGNAGGHYMLGLSAWKSGDLDRAEKGFDEALKLDPKHVKSLINWSRVLLDRNQPDAAVEKLTLAGELDSKSGVVKRLLGRAYHAQGKIDDAVAAYREAIVIDPQDSWAMNNLGLLFLDQGRAEDALPLLARAVELGKDVASFHNNLGMALEHTGRFSAAAAEYTGALTADPAYQKAKLNLARVEKVKEDPKEPFDLEAAAKSVVEPAAKSAEDATAVEDTTAASEAN